MGDPADFVIDDANGHLIASKNRDYKERVKLRFATFIAFLQHNHLTTRVILEEGDEVTSKTTIRRSDLTDLGFGVVQKAYYKWLSGIDKGKPIDDVSIFAKALEKLRRDSDQKTS